MSPTTSIDTAPIGVLGGTFDPVHLGHLALAKRAQQTLALAHVRLIPIAKPNHRQPPTANDEHRLAMLKAVCDGVNLIADNREIERGDISYTVDTLASLRREFGTRGICFILGQDAFNKLNAWHQWRRLLTLCHLIVVNRPGIETLYDADLQQCLDRALTTKVDILNNSPAGAIYFLEIPPQAVSSTVIRERLSRAQAITHLVSSKVEDIIQREKLYR